MQENRFEAIVLVRFAGRWCIAALIVMSSVGMAYGQCTFGAPNCTSSIASNVSINFNALIWAGGSCPTGSAYTGNLALTMGANSTLTVTADYTITGDFNITTSGASPTITIPLGVTFRVTGNLGDCTNNNTTYVVNGALIVDGFLSGKNNNGFSGTGSITAGGLNFGNNTTCTSCSIVWDVNTCTASPVSFCTLPIKLLFFKAEVNRNVVHLRWATESEENFDFFTVEKSTDGKNFYSVNDIPGHGNSTERHDYAFTDEHPLSGKSYYRLRETDFDGLVVFHQIVSVDFSGERSVNIYPVPVSNGILNIRLNFSVKQESRITINDTAGLVLQSFVSPDEQIAVPLNLKPGIYFLTFTNGDFRTTKRFLVN